MTHEEYLAHKKAVREQMIKDGMTPPEEGKGTVLDWNEADERASDRALDKLFRRNTPKSSELKPSIENP